MHIAPTPFDFSNCELGTEPFSHFRKLNAVSESNSSEVLNWLECDAPWCLRIADFYEQYEFSFHDIGDGPKTVLALYSSPIMSSLKLVMERKFGASLQDRIDLTAHKLVPGQTIKIHNDYIPGQETHRLLIQLNRNWSEEDGGLLMLFAEDKAESLHTLVPPINGSVFAFQISPVSHHAVSTVHGGERYTLVYSFYEC